MVVVTECMYRHAECVCVCIYTYIKDICFSVYCYVCVLMHFLLREGNSKLSPSLVTGYMCLCSEVCMLLCAFVCVRKNVLRSHI